LNTTTRFFLHKCKSIQATTYPNGFGSQPQLNNCLLRRYLALLQTWQ